MTFTFIYVAIGLLFVVMALSDSVLKRLPLSAALIYLSVGIALGPSGAGLIDLDAVTDAPLVERLTEVAVIVSLFTAGLKLRVDWRDPLWHLPVRLASLSMLVTVGLVTIVGVTLLDLPVGAAILLGAVLAPTDPVLASDVQVTHTADRDRLRFGLTGEAGLNDGTAFPFVMLGLGLLGHHELGPGGLRWFGVDLLWATAGGLAIGAFMGAAVGHLVLALRRSFGQATGRDDFLALGLIALSYGAALLVHAYGFLAVFAAGLALRRIEHRHSGEDVDAVDDAVTEAGDQAAVKPETAPAYMTNALLGFNEQLERIGEVAIVVIVGALLAGSLTSDAIWFVPLLLLVLRPIAVWAGTRGMTVNRFQLGLMSWFGVRGIGSVYYLTFAIAHGVDGAIAETLVDITLATIAASAVAHGISVTPLMERYERRVGMRNRLSAAPSESA